MKINQLFSLVNYTDASRTKNDIKYIVIHYVGATGGAKSNANYFYSVYRAASAHYFVGHASENAAIWQIVRDEDIAWHAGTNGAFYHPNARNSNSIGIELCCHKKADGTWYFDKETVLAAAELTKELMAKYDVPKENVLRHYDITHKQCPAMWVDETRWENEFKSLLVTKATYRWVWNPTLKEQTLIQNGTNQMMKDFWYWDKDYQAWYYLKPDGRMARTQWVKSGEHWYYIKTSGTMAKNELFTVSGKLYAFDNSGKMLTNMRIGSDGVITSL